MIGQDLRGDNNQSLLLPEIVFECFNKNLNSQMFITAISQLPGITDTTTPSHNNIAMYN